MRSPCVSVPYHSRVLSVLMYYSHSRRRDLLTTFGVDVDIAEKEVEDDDPMMDVGEAEKTEENKTGHPAAPPRPRRPTYVPLSMPSAAALLIFVHYSRNVPLNATFTSLNMSAKISGAGAMRVSA